MCADEEWDAAAHSELLKHPFPPSCCFQDIAQFFVPPVQVQLDEFRNGNMLQTKLMELVASGVAIQT